MDILLISKVCRFGVFIRRTLVAMVEDVKTIGLIMKELEVLGTFDKVFR